MVIINKLCSTEQHTQHRRMKKDDLLWYIDTHPIIRPGVLFFFYIGRKCHPNYDLPSNLYPSVALSLSPLFHPFCSALLTWPLRRSKARPDQRGRTVGKEEERAREGERNRERETSKERQNNNKIISAGSLKLKLYPTTYANVLQ